jgi:phosphoribosylformylglycinamidine synthase I
MRKPKALILLATGTNRDHDIASALTLAGAETEIVPLNLLKSRKKNWDEFQILALPGGFSYADALGAGKLLAIDLNSYFSEQLNLFNQRGKAIIGICNGFQALVKSGILPGQFDKETTLTFNQAGHFECRWITMKAISQKCIWTRDLQDLIECPIAHGEGNFQAKSGLILNELQQNDQIALVYIHPDGQSANGQYPANPNGSMLNIAGICNAQGNILGLMPHPENHIYTYQHPQWTRTNHQASGLSLFINGVSYASQQ